jgi:hypothetical protein
MADTPLLLESQDIQPGRDTGSGTQGGAAAIYGFLHQITLSIRQLLHAQFGKTAGKLDPATITAIFEPTAGGDISIETPAREVSQIKHRARAVSIADISAKILPDLYRAHCDKQAARYSLHTTNGVSKPALALIDACKRWAKGTSDQPAAPVAPHLAAVIENCTVIHTAVGNFSSSALSSFPRSVQTMPGRKSNDGWQRASPMATKVKVISTSWSAFFSTRHRPAML